MTNMTNILLNVTDPGTVSEFVRNASGSCVNYKQPLINANIPIFIISAIISLLVLTVIPFLPEKYREKVSEKMVVTIFMLNLGFALVSIFQGMGI